jgi:hypothetical protein
MKYNFEPGSIQYSYGGTYKWNLDQNASIQTDIYLLAGHIGPYLQLDEGGRLTCSLGYQWDGASFIAVDTATIMRGSLFHDALYQLMREGVVSRKNRKKADQILRDLCLADGMTRIRAAWVYSFVRVFARSASKRRRT